MKLLTVAIPCYNSAGYMKRAIDSALSGGEDIEILIVNDGSTDNTVEIAKAYEEKYPDIVRVISKENGGHGSAVNTGLDNASGIYYKVLDSDDWFDVKSFAKVIAFLKDVVAKQTPLDMLIFNYVYEKPSLGKRRAINYRSAMPVFEFFTWSEMKHFKASQNILMHSVVYRTKLLRDCGIRLPEHTFYVDSIFVYTPMPYVKYMYYMDLDVYRYYIGREDQSVNESVMIGRIDQQITVTKTMIAAHELASLKNEKLRKYMTHYLSMMMTVCSALLVKSGTPENLEKHRKLWKYLKTTSPQTYKLINKTFLGRPLQMHTVVGRQIIKTGYELSRKFYGFS